MGNNSARRNAQQQREALSVSLHCLPVRLLPLTNFLSCGDLGNQGEHKLQPVAFEPPL